MALNDIRLFDDATYMPGTKRFTVKGQGRAAGIKAGELVLKALGNTTGYYVTAWTPGLAASAVKPSVGTHYIAGLAMSTSTETATLDGVVDVMPNLPGTTYLIAPYDSTLWDTQAEYDALVGARVLINYAATTGKMTILAQDSTASYGNGYYGCIIEPLDITLHPNKVRFSLRQGLNYFA